MHYGIVHRVLRSPHLQIPSSPPLSLIIPGFSSLKVLFWIRCIKCAIGNHEHSHESPGYLHDPPLYFRLPQPRLPPFTSTVTLVHFNYPLNHVVPSKAASNKLDYGLAKTGRSLAFHRSIIELRDLPRGFKIHYPAYRGHFYQ